MNRTILTGMIACLLHSIPASEAQETRSVDPAAEIDGIPLLGTPFIPSGNNRWQWHADETTGSHRDIGQRITTGREPLTVDRYILRIAEIEQAVGHGAAGAPFRFRIVRFANAQEKMPTEPAIVLVEGRLPARMNPGESLVIDFPETTLEGGSTYGLELAFTEAAGERHLNLATSAREDFPTGLLYFIPGSSGQEYVFKPGSFCFQLMKR